MPLQFVTTNLTGPTGFTLAAGDNLQVVQGVTVSGEINGIEMLESNQSAIVAGTVMAGNAGIFVGDNATTDGALNLSLASTSQVLSLGDGVVVRANNATVSNRGVIEGLTGAGFAFDGTSSSFVTLMNSGTIFGANGIVMNGQGTLYITNSGTIAAGSVSGYAIRAFGADSVYLRNTGTIEGDIATGAGADFVSTNGNIGRMFLGAGDDSVTVRGVLTDGIVSLDTGRDFYYGLRATGDVLIFGGGDDDFFFIGAAAEDIDGGTGTDTVDYFYARSGQSVVLLAGDQAYEVGADVFASIENLKGSRLADNFTGSTADNFLMGAAGEDTLSGGVGADTLEGGLGADVLTGGTGNDRFRYFNNNEGADVITDFSNTATDNDQFVFEVEMFFNPWGGLAEGVLAAAQFQTRADNRAQDADDRFIFRTTDNTLWFDMNGNASGGARLIADLQAGVVLTAADILIV